MAERKPWEGRAPSSAIGAIVRHFLSIEESNEIHRQLQKRWLPNRQVLHDGIHHAIVQSWADHHGVQTLAALMGRLMNPKHPSCRQSVKSNLQWSDYLHGASVIFCWLIAQGQEVTVLLGPASSNKTGDHSEGQPTFYETVQEPIVTGKIGDNSVRWLHVVQPTVKGAAKYTCVVRAERSMVTPHKSHFGAMISCLQEKFKRNSDRRRIMTYHSYDYCPETWPDTPSIKQGGSKSAEKITSHNAASPRSKAHHRTSEEKKPKASEKASHQAASKSSKETLDHTGTKSRSDGSRKSKTKHRSSKVKGSKMRDKTLPHQATKKRTKEADASSKRKKRETQKRNHHSRSTKRKKSREHA